MAPRPGGITIGAMDDREYQRALAVAAVDRDLRAIVRDIRLLERDCARAQARLVDFEADLVQLRTRLLCDTPPSAAEPRDSRAPDAPARAPERLRPHTGRPAGATAAR
jgi:hypothetical protein